ncbi:tetratricopeptide repeat protein [Streptosporangium sp. NBC_01639]|uniref:AfsR/SARP family transcriptional regulator n=1 Tax=Streptosporangium sp. NBC_01639 TaxID=2975948 RepID=UPI0038702462|nr:tetratricopeptide repeat protein [Streptosporangium sp. NBC_01639]
MNFLMLGRLEIRDVNGTIVPVRRLKHRQLLATLLLEANFPVSNHQLMESLWGDDPPPSAERNIKTYVHTLRKLLCPDDLRSTPIETQADGYLIALDRDDLDLSVFRDHVRQAKRAARNRDSDTAHHHFERALDLWRGKPLLDTKGSRALDDAAARLSEEYVASLEELSEIRLSLGRYREVVSDLRPAVSANPLRERLWGQLMLGLYGAGDRAAALSTYQGLRKTIVEETGLEPSRPIQNLHQRILASASVLDLTAPQAPLPAVEARPQAPIPRQLPRDPADFVGRAEELVRLGSLLAPWDGNPPQHIVAITGAPGSGKSTLAVRAAHMARGHFPDGQLYANLHGATPGIKQLEPAEVIGRFLRDLGVPPHIVPDDADEAAAVWRSELDGRKILVVLDDAADLAQVRPLLSVPVGNTILTTSRETFAMLDGCAEVPLGSLRGTEASAILAKLAGAQRVAEDMTATAHLISLCGSLPLAVRIAGARLANRPHWHVADLVERLANERRRLHELEVGDLAVRSSLTVSYDLLLGSAHPLNRMAARALCELGLLQVPDVAPHIVGALLDVPSDLAERAMERLVDGHLAEVDETGRYRLHDLVRLFANEQAPQQGTPAARGAALDRALSSYVATARLAVDLLDYPNGAPAEVDLSTDPAPLASEEEARTWLRRERANLLSAASQAMEAPEERTARLGVALTFSLFWHFHHSGLPPGFHAVNQQCLAAGQRLGDRGIEADAHNYLAISLSMANRCEDAVRHVQRQLFLCRELSDPHGERRALGSLAELHLRLNHYEEALGFAEGQWRIATALGHNRGQHHALTMIGAAHHHLGRLDQAFTVLGDALARTRRNGDVYQETSVLEKLGDIHLDRGDPAAARDHYRAALSCAHTAKVTVAEPYMLLGLARSSRLLGEVEQASAYLERAFATAEVTRDRLLEKPLAQEREALLAARGRPLTVPDRVMTP